LVSVNEYLATSYRPDREFIDGELIERNVGEWSHSRLQALLLKQLLNEEDRLGILVVPEQRVQVKAARFRVPDLSVVKGDPEESILRTPPLVCIEILSPDDSMSSMQERIDDYIEFGVLNVWVFDPRRKKAFWADRDGVHELVGESLEATGVPVRIDLRLIWGA